MPNTLIIIIIIIVVLNAVFLFIYLSKPSQNAQANVTQNQSSTVPINIVSNQTAQNKTVDLSLIYQLNCINSTRKYVESLKNITNITVIESRTFNKSNDAKGYLQKNWSSILYDIKGMEKDILNYSVVSVFDIRTNRERNFTLPIVCDYNGKMGNYSSCLLNNIPNIPSSCENLTLNLTECEIEWRDHFLMDDINYWITPPGGALIISSLGIANKTTQVFNFTISSSRKMLESFGMDVIQRRFNPINDDVIFSSNKNTADGKGGSIVTTINITYMKGSEIYATVWFKKKCYDKFVIY